MNIGMIGTGYVGLILGVVLSKAGHQVVCVDTDAERIRQLTAGQAPFHEPGLQPLLEAGIAEGCLAFTTSIREATEHGDILYIAVGTPAEADGGADLSYALSAAQDIGRYMNGDKVVIVKSTVPLGTVRRLAGLIRERLSERELPYRLDIVSNPEFLREGNALEDSLHPDRIIIGTEHGDIPAALEPLFRRFRSSDIPVLVTDIETAEMIKYASNSFLAVKISFMNELALVAEKTGANITDVALGMGLDPRISPHFLQAGAGYGGSCFPKDTRAIVHTAKAHDEQLYIIQAAIDSNEKQKHRMEERISAALSPDGQLQGKTIAVLGLTFKPNTDDMRDAPSIDIISGLAARGAAIRAFCPGHPQHISWKHPAAEKRVTYADDAVDCARGADAVVLMTEWGHFAQLNMAELRSVMRDELLFDLRNMWTRHPDVRRLFDYRPVGLK